MDQSITGTCRAGQRSNAQNRKGADWENPPLRTCMCMRKWKTALLHASVASTEPGRKRLHATSCYFTRGPYCGKLLASMHLKLNIWLQIHDTARGMWVAWGRGAPQKLRFALHYLLRLDLLFLDTHPDLELTRTGVWLLVSLRGWMEVYGIMPILTRVLRTSHLS